MESKEDDHLAGLSFSEPTDENPKRQTGITRHRRGKPGGHVGPMAVTKVIF